MWYDKTIEKLLFGELGIKSDKGEMFMYITPTPHNEAALGEIAKTVLMPGDPLRAQEIADGFLEDYVCVNTVRNMLAFTGTYMGKEISVMGSGMGMPSIGIYSYELFHHYDVDCIIRVGSAGGISKKVGLRDIVAVMGASTNSNYASQFHLPGTFAPIADFGLLRHAVEIAEEKGLSIHVGNILSSDVFYNDLPEDSFAWEKMGILAVEMEAAALYMNAARAGKKALGLMTISDHLATGEALSSDERQTGFAEMIGLALDTAATMD